MLGIFAEFIGKLDLFTIDLIPKPSALITFFFLDLAAKLTVDYPPLEYIVFAYDTPSNLSNDFIISSG